MKKSLLNVAAFALSLFLYASCTTDDNHVGNVSNYWTANSLVHDQLSGAVRTVTTNSGLTVTTYNADGNKVSTVTSGTGFSNSVTYNYENGKLVSEIASTQNSEEVSKRAATTSIIYYEYENGDKYIPSRSNHFAEEGLMQGLSAVIQDDSRNDFTFHGNDLWMVFTETNGSEITRDTVVVPYDGNYPASLTTDWNYCKDMTYASNGMFLNYTEGFYGATYDDAYVYTFLAHDTYMLPSKVVETYQNSASGSLVTLVYTTNYTYNDRMDITSQISDTYTQEYSDYVYDAQGNWVSRNYRYKYLLEAWSDYTTETRAITYW